MAFFIHETCTGCTACARQCPTDAIRGSPDQRFVIETGKCTDCGVCGMVCPEEQTISDERGVFARHVPRSERPTPRFDEKLCTGCMACVDICPFGCLSLTGPFHVGVARLSAPDTCVSCGYCEDVCLKAAVELIKENLGATSTSG